MATHYEENLVLDDSPVETLQKRMMDVVQDHAASEKLGKDNAENVEMRGFSLYGESGLFDLGTLVLIFFLFQKPKKRMITIQF